MTRTITATERRGSDRLVLAAGLILGLALLFASPVGDFGPFHQLWHGRHVLVQAFIWAAFALAVVLVFRARRRAPIRAGLVVLVAACCQIPGLLCAPQASGDAYRYVWDGRVQLSGVSPYRYVPFDDHLAPLRDPVLFPGLSPRQLSGVTTPTQLPHGRAKVTELAQNDPRTRINRPRVPTIYPPVAQIWFAAIAAVTPWSWGTAGLQWASALLAVGLTALLAGVLRRRTGDSLAAIYWGWCPLVVLETGNNAHVDVLAAALVLGAVLVLAQSGRRSRIGGGALLGLAIAAKIMPLVLLPALTVLRRGRAGWRGLTVPLAAGAVVLLSYLPYLLTAGSLVLGYLPGYLAEEGFSDGNQRYALLGLVLPDHLRQPVAALLLLTLAVLALWRAGAGRPEHVCLWMFGGALLISTPAYPWYCLPVLALAALANRPEWLGLAIALEWSYLHIHTSAPLPVGWGYALALAAVLAAAAVRARRASLPIPAEPPKPALPAGVSGGSD